jgi:hypothetical protein
MKKPETNVYEIELHEEVEIASSFYCRRVPGGWIYSDYSMTDQGNAVFVPFDNEFQRRNER